MGNIILEGMKLCHPLSPKVNPPP